MNPGNWVFSVMLSTVAAVACYIFGTCQPILIFFVDSKAVVLSTVYKYIFFAWPFLCNTSLSTRSMLSAVWVLRHLLLPEQWLTHQ